jgi:hypothetical protein
VRRRLGSRLIRLSLRRRVAVTFGIGLLVITGMLATVTWNLASNYMIRQRETSATRQGEVNARLSTMRLAGESLDDLLNGLTRSPSRVCCSVAPEALPGPLLSSAKAGKPANERLTVDGLPVLAVTRPVDPSDTAFIQLSPLIQLARALRFISFVLLAVSSPAPCSPSGSGSGRAAAHCGHSPS